jgi:hypothetical protein
MIDEFREGEDVPPRTFPMTIVAQDPTVRDARKRILTAEVQVPADILEPGPRTHRFHVVDYDATTGQIRPQADLRVGALGPSAPWRFHDRFAGKPSKVLLTDFAFHAQNAYAIAARTLSTFEFALGRRLPWGFRGHELYIAPHAFAEANAYYSDDDRALFFGYVPPGGPRSEPIYTCLSHDIVAHESTHAVLDGLRDRFDEPGLPDQAAFHEAFADIVALLSVFSIQEVVENALGRSDIEGRIDSGRVKAEELEGSVLFKLAEELGDEVAAERGSGLRRSVGLTPSPDWDRDPQFQEPHRRGEVLVAILMKTLALMWGQRLTALIGDRRLDRERAAEEGARAARHLLEMSIRSIDYLPPLEFEFVDFLDSILTSDGEVTPDDRMGYRTALEAAFGAWGIVRSGGRIVNLAATGRRPVYGRYNFGALRTDPDEVFRFVWDNAELLGIDRRYYVHVEHVRPSIRVGPEGLIVSETVADYVQMLEGSAAEVAEAVPMELPPQLDPSADVQILGGGTIIFDQFGAAKYHQKKGLLDPDRQSRRLRYLVENALIDTTGRFGFSLGIPRGQRFALLHEPDDLKAEGW